MHWDSALLFFFCSFVRCTVVHIISIFMCVLYTQSNRSESFFRLRLEIERRIMEYFEQKRKYSQNHSEYAIIQVNPKKINAFPQVDSINICSRYVCSSSTVVTTNPETNEEEGGEVELLFDYYHFLTINSDETRETNPYFRLHLLLFVFFFVWILIEAKCFAKRPKLLQTFACINSLYFARSVVTIGRWMFSPFFLRSFRNMPNCSFRAHSFFPWD